MKRHCSIAISLLFCLCISACARDSFSAFETRLIADKEIGERLSAFNEPSVNEFARSKDKHAYRLTGSGLSGSFSVLTLSINKDGTGLVTNKSGRGLVSRKTEKKLDASTINEFLHILEDKELWKVLTLGRENYLPPIEPCNPEGEEEYFCELVIVHADGGPLWFEAKNNGKYVIVEHGDTGALINDPYFHDSPISDVIDMIRKMAFRD